MSVLSSRSLTAALLVGLSLFGGFGVWGSGFIGGSFEALETAAKPKTGKPFYPGGPPPDRTQFTGVESVDGHIRILLGFFTLAIDAPQTWAETLAYYNFMIHFAGGSILIILEGMRKGNVGRVVSW